MAVLDPLKVVITNYPEGQVEQMEVENNPKIPRPAPANAVLARAVHRARGLSWSIRPRNTSACAGPGRAPEERLHHPLREDFVKDPATGEVTECAARTTRTAAAAPTRRASRPRARCTGCPPTRQTGRGASVRPPVHRPDARRRMRIATSWSSSTPIQPARCRAGVRRAEPRRCASRVSSFQFMRMGYFCADAVSTPDRLVFNRTVTLRDTWAKVQQNT
jgi:glutaminyl-tRNA synthetase